jgi:hypothetical protein
MRVYSFDYGDDDDEDAVQVKIAIKSFFVGAMRCVRVERTNTRASRSNDGWMVLLVAC